MTTRIKLLALSLLALSMSYCSLSPKIDAERISKEKEPIIKKFWDELDLKDVISYDVFHKSMVGYYCIEPKVKNTITIIDYSKPSTERRFYVVDLKNKKLLYNCLVAHGKNSGENYAKDFSNVPESKKSSLGFFIAAETYSGKHGHSLRLDGIEKGINNNARERYIVIHGADYVSQEFINDNERLGRSWGCPALPRELSTEIIDSISGGSCIFIYSNDDDYFASSEFMVKNIREANRD